MINKLLCSHLWEATIPNYNTLGKAASNYKLFEEIKIIFYFLK